MADFSELPHGVLVNIFSGLAPLNPDSVRDLCAAASVCPSWREAAKEPSLWRKLYVLNAPLNERLTGPRLQNLVARSGNTLIELLLEGCSLVNDAMLVLPLQQQPCLEYVQVTDCERLSRDGLAYALCDSEDFQGVVEQLNDPRQSAENAKRCCMALRTLLQEDEEEEEEEEAILAEAQAVGTLDALLRCAAVHATHAGVQAACCWALSEYVQTAQRTEVTSYPRIFQAVVAALKAYPLDVNVQSTALNALLNACCFGLEGTPGVPALLDAIRLVLAALRAFPTGLEMQANGCYSLARMCNINASVAESVAAAGAMGLFIKALNLTRTNAHTLVAAVDAIGALALSKAALPQASLGIDTVVRIQRDYQNSKLAAAACKTLSIYLRCPTTRERAIQAGAEDVIWELLEVYSDDEAVQEAANEALEDPQA